MRRNQFDVGVPFGGYKQSGIGREKGQAAMDHYTQVGNVVIMSCAHTAGACVSAHWRHCVNADQGGVHAHAGAHLLQVKRVERECQGKRRECSSERWHPTT